MRTMKLYLAGGNLTPDTNCVRELVYKEGTNTPEWRDICE